MIHADTLHATGPLRRLRARFERFLLPPMMTGERTVWMNLLYLLFLFMPLLFPRFPTIQFGATFLAIAAFLPLYFLTYRLRGWRLAAIALAIAALGPALLPSNPFSNTFTIYGVLAAVELPLPAALGVMVVSIVMLGIAHFAIDPFAAPFVLVLTTLISGSSFFGMRYYLANARKQAALRLSQEEVERLAKLAERERIGRDLHDLLGHTLSVIAIKAELASKLSARDAEAARAEIADVERIAREALGQVRRAVTGMRAVGIRAEFANARLALSAVLVDFDYRAPELALHPETETVLALALREATTNIIRHADARRCTADLAREGANVVLVVRDDGVGGAVAGGNGLDGMRERVEALGGSLGIESASGQGTTLRIALPFREPGPAPADESTPEQRRRRLRAVG
jgi:two-component system sensor histidine kinase DesK